MTPLRPRRQRHPRDLGRVRDSLQRLPLNGTFRDPGDVCRRAGPVIHEPFQLERHSRTLQSKYACSIVGCGSKRVRYYLLRAKTQGTVRMAAETALLAASYLKRAVLREETLEKPNPYQEQIEEAIGATTTKLPGTLRLPAS